MSTITGQVKRTITKDWNGKTFYSLSLVGQDPLYGFGGSNPRADDGDSVTFEAEKNDKGYWTAVKGSLKVTKGVDKVASGTKAAAAASGQSGYWDRKEARDVQNDHLRTVGASRNTAIEWVKFLLAQEAYKLPAPTKREEFLNSLLDDYTTKFMGAADQGPPSAETAHAVEALVPTKEEEWR